MNSTQKLTLDHSRILLRIETRRILELWTFLMKMFDFPKRLVLNTKNVLF